jgi:predicted nucleic acid-binding protein
MVVFDTSMLILLLDDTIRPPWNNISKQPVTFVKERIQGLIDFLDKNKEQVLIPTPALSETLVYASKARATYLGQFTKTAAFRIVPFGEKAAIEAADMTAKALSQGNKRGDMLGCWLKIKHDRQIVAVAKAEGVSVIYSNDNDIKNIAELERIQVIDVASLPIPAATAQASLRLTYTPPLSSPTDYPAPLGNRATNSTRSERPRGGEWQKNNGQKKGSAGQPSVEPHW